MNFVHSKERVYKFYKCKSQKFIDQVKEKYVTSTKQYTNLTFPELETLK